MYAISVERASHTNKVWRFTRGHSHDINVGNMSYNQQTLKRVRVHAGEKPYACDRCRSSFAEKRSIDMHMRIHRETIHV